MMQLNVHHRGGVLGLLGLLTLAPNMGATESAGMSGIARSEPGTNMLVITLEPGDGRQVMVKMPAEVGESARVEDAAAGWVYEFRTVVPGEGLVVQPAGEPLRGGEMVLAVERHSSKGRSDLRHVAIGQRFELGEMEASVITSGPGETQPGPLTERMIMLRVRAGTGEWVEGAVWEGELFRVQSTEGPGIALAPVYQADGSLSIHVYELTQVEGVESRKFESVIAITPGETALVTLPSGIYEIGISEKAAAVGGLVSPFQPGPISRVDNTQCWIGCGSFTAHGCIIWACGFHCCGTRCC
jgi:hypothetical protein